MTKFAIIASYQYSENYGDEETPHWKMKGGHEAVISEELTITEVVELGTDGINAMVEVNGPKSNPYAGYDLCDWELVELNDSTITKVRDYIRNRGMGDDLGFARYMYGCDVGTEFEFDWAVKQLDLEAA